MHKIRTVLPGSLQQSSMPSKRQQQNAANENVVPEIGFQISIVSNERTTLNEANGVMNGGLNEAASACSALVPELQVHLIAARHLPALFGFKVVQGYLIKVSSKFLKLSLQPPSYFYSLLSLI